MNFSRRKPNWNYGWRGFYFITINCRGKRKYFGSIKDGEMQYSELGIKAKEIWSSVPEQFPFITIDEFQVMPDHFHALVIINENQKMNWHKVKEGQGGWAREKSPMIYNNLSQVVRWFKGRCTFECRKLNPSFTWQSTFDDRIVRDKHSFIKIQKYIRDNPLDWS